MPRECDYIRFHLVPMSKDARRGHIRYGKVNVIELRAIFKNPRNEAFIKKFC